MAYHTSSSHHHLLHIIFIIIIFFILSFCFTTHILIAKKPTFNAQHYFNIVTPPLKDVYYTSTNNVAELKNQNQKSFILDKFRILLGLHDSFFSNGKSRTNGGESPCPSPSPSPGPSPSPAIAPEAHIHRRAHPPLHHHHYHPLSLPHKTLNKDKGKSKKIVTAVVTSVGITSVVCAIALFFGCWKLKKHKRRRKRSVSIIHRGGETGNKGISKFITSQSSVKKVSSDPGPDLFYLNSLETALEPQIPNCCVKLNSSTEKVYEVDEREESNKKLIINSECESSFGEITAVHEISEVVKDEHVCFGIIEDKIVCEEEANSSDDESFHSISDSHSSQLRLSNASSSSVAEIPEIPHSNPNFSAPRPPPPPPPPLVSPPPPAFSSMKTKPNFLKSSKLPNLSQSKLPLSSSNKSPAGVPPPPCPPPLERSHANSLKVPPPPPSQLITQQIPLGKDGSPLPKLKPLHWDKVRATPDRSTVWDKLRSSSFEFDEEMIESLFGYNLQNNLMKNDEAKSKTPSPSKHVLEPKRLQNITILSKGLNVTAEQVCVALIRGEGLSLQDLEALSKMVPTKEEESKLENYKGEIFELGSAEILVKAMLKIPFAFSRIEAMLYRETFEDEVLHLTKSFSILQEACNELRSSRLFLKLLEAVLKTGNRMNVGTIRGGAKAFKLDALLKLADVKGTDGKTTLLHFVVQEIIRSEGIRVSESIMGKIQQKSKNTNTQDKEEIYRKMGLDLVSSLTTELCNAKKTATIDLDVLASSVANLSNGMNKLQDLVENEMKMEEKKGNFVNTTRLFLKYAERKLMEVQEDENRVLLHVREITEYFHGDVSKDESNPLRIFVIVRDFLSMLDNVCKELRSSNAPRSPNPLAPFR